VRLITRNDASLSVALVAAAVILFRQPLRDVLDTVQAIEARFRLDFMPALLLLVVVFSFHHYRRRLQVRAEAMAAAADAAAARRQSKTLQQLISLSHALGNTLDRTALQQALWKHLPLIVGDRQFWVLVRHGNGWDTVIHDTANDRRPTEVLEQMAARALAGPDQAVDSPAAPAADGGDVCFPMIVGGAVVGVLGVGRTPLLPEDQFNAVAAAAAMVAIAFTNMQLLADTREMSVRDGLTGCFNRAYAVDTLNAELRRSRRTGAPLSVVMFDVDHFKGINDRFGHLAGDALLKAVGEQLERMLRRTDVRCRYGGDEFLLILPETPLLGAQQVAEGLRQTMNGVRIPVQGPTPPLTVSIGVTAALPGETDAQELVARADGALYQAKRAGRNRAVVATTRQTEDAGQGPAPLLSVGWA
jgi:diguanylate cyclase (GGDEF)-like protein